MEDIKGFEGKYAVTEDGHIWIHRKRRLMTEAISNCGYPRVQLNRKWHSVHRLVALAYLPPVKGKPYVNHKDGNKKHNHTGNLQWSTMSENIKHAYDLGLKKPSWAVRYGEDNHKAVLTEQNVREIVRDVNKFTQQELADKYAVSKSTIKHILRGRHWIHITDGINAIPKKVNKRTLLSPEKVTMIRSLYRAGKKQIDIAREFEVDISVIGKIIHGTTWKKVPDPQAT